MNIVFSQWKIQNSPKFFSQYIWILDVEASSNKLKDILFQWSNGILLNTKIALTYGEKKMF